MHITVIDDSPTTVVILKSLSSNAGAEAIGFTEPERAFEFLRQATSNLIIVDYSMPHMTGIELIKRLRGTELHQKTPIVMVTTSSEIAVRARALEVGANAFLQKPLKAIEFLECVKKAAQDMPSEF